MKNKQLRIVFLFLILSVVNTSARLSLKTSETSRRFTPRTGTESNITRYVHYNQSTAIQQSFYITHINLTHGRRIGILPILIHNLPQIKDAFYSTTVSDKCTVEFVPVENINKKIFNL